MVLACGNAPTFIYAAINTLIEEKVDLSKLLYYYFLLALLMLLNQNNMEESFVIHLM